MDEKNVRSKWVRCPYCRSKTRTKIFPYTILLHFPLYCPKCKKEIEVNIIQSEMTIIK